MPNHMQTTYTILGLLENLYGLRALALAVPQPDSSIITSADDHTTIFPAKAHTIDATEVPSPSSQCSSCGYIPEKDLFVAANAGEPGIIVCNGEIKDFVAVGGIGLNEA